MTNLFKNFILCILTFLFIQIPASAIEISELSLIKDSNIQNIKAVADFYSRQSNYNVTSGAEYSVVYTNNKNYYVTFFEQTGNDVYFYFYSPSGILKDYKNIVSRLKNKGNTCKTDRNKSQKQIFYNKVKSIMNVPPVAQKANPAEQLYDFSDSAQEKYNAINKVLENRPSQPLQIEQTPEQSKRLNVFVEKDNYVTVPQTQITYPQSSSATVLASKYDIPGGLSIPVVIQSDIETSSLAQNDRISAILQQDLCFNNQIKAKSGSIVYGSVVEVKSAGGGYKNGALVLQFDSILTTEGEKLSLKTEKYNFTMPDSKRAAKITGQVVGRAAAGAIGGLLIGLLACAFDSSSSISKGIAYGAAIGAGAGAISGGVSAATAKGEDVSVTEGTVLVLKTVSN